ncbi:hypothetical protein [Clostridium tagluense]|uniref:Uncharacterized protein n=1 Tax=Clostridium tagluense TaxID=360422 RepID=A0A401UU62_9CLOT|nr:hypothetical protein [Clostridium tagluense]GCD12988.1 hypothetical protein Ctaglu_46110 [Clostridium tagluense]
MNIKFSQNLIKYLAVYLGTSLEKISKEKGFNYSKPYLYKIAEGSLQVNDNTNEVFNKFWNDREMTSEDLENIYSLIGLIETGKLKEKQFKGGK